MPSSMTHTYFGLDVYNNLKEKYQNKITNKLEYYKLFCQGSDPFMFYHFMFGKKAKQISHIQKTMHLTKTRDYFINTIKYIHSNNLINNEDVLAYLYGYICHYYLDMYVHPLIYYKGGIFKKNEPKTYKYNGIHQAIEYAIDLYLIEKNENLSANKFKIHKRIYNVKSLSPDLKKLIDTTIEKTYHINNASDIYQKSIWYMTNFFRLANYDPYGIKLKIYKLIDSITPNNIIKIKELSYSNKYNNINNYLNSENNIWYCPWDKNISYQTSFFDLYKLALHKSVKTIEEVTDILETKNLDANKLNKLFKNLSYATGLDCNIKVDIKYFEY